MAANGFNNKNSGNLNQSDQLPFPTNGALVTDLRKSTVGPYTTYEAVINGKYQMIVEDKTTGRIYNKTNNGK